jgi:hypothetical protein
VTRKPSSTSDNTVSAERFLRPPDVFLLLFIVDGAADNDSATVSS